MLTTATSEIAIERAGKNFLAISPRLKSNGDVVYGDFTLDFMDYVTGHRVRYWTPRDRETHEPTGPMGLATILGTESADGKLIARGFEPIDVDDPEEKIDIEMGHLGGKTVTSGSYDLDSDGKPKMMAVTADKDFYYVKMSTGLVQTRIEFTDPQSQRKRARFWVEDDLLMLARKRIPVEEHGFHTLGGADELLGTEATSDLKKDESKLMWSTASRSKIFGTTIPQCRWSLFRIDRRGGEGAVQDIGVFIHFKGELERLIITDVRGRADLREIWRRREQERIDLHKAGLVAKRLAREAKTGQKQLPLLEETAPVA